MSTRALGVVAALTWVVALVEWVWIGTMVGVPQRRTW